MKSLSLNQMATTKGNGGPTFNNSCSLCEYGYGLLFLYSSNPLITTIANRFINLHCTGKNTCEIYL